jgi:hypothetical protein
MVLGQKRIAKVLPLGTQLHTIFAGTDVEQYTI